LPPPRCPTAGGLRTVSHIDHPLVIGLAEDPDRVATIDDIADVLDRLRLLHRQLDREPLGPVLGGLLLADLERLDRLTSLPESVGDPNRGCRLDGAVRPATRIGIGSELAKLGKLFGGLDLQITRDKAPAKPADLV
jgi:hypothetical protein